MSDEQQPQNNHDEQDPQDKRKNEWRERGETFVEEFEVAGNDLVRRVQELVEQGNVRRLLIRNNEGELLLEIPLTAAVVGGGAVAIFAPIIAALGAMAALMVRLRIEVVRVAEAEVQHDDDEPPQNEPKQKIDIEDGNH